MVENIESKEPGETSTCIHFFKIETPKDNVSVGTCKNCNFTRTFTQTSEDHIASKFYEKRKIVNERKRKISKDPPQLILENDNHLEDISNFIELKENGELT